MLQVASLTLGKGGLLQDLRGYTPLTCLLPNAASVQLLILQKSCTDIVLKMCSCQQVIINVKKLCVLLQCYIFSGL